VGRTTALRLLEAKPRTQRELREALCGRGIPEDVADEIVVRFCEVGLLDDRLFAQLWVQSRMRSRGLGVGALRRELRRHKVPEDIVDEVLDDVDAHDSVTAAVEQVRGRVARCRLPLDVKDERRLVAFLMRRGHSLDAARDALARAVEEVADDSR